VQVRTYVLTGALCGAIGLRANGSYAKALWFDEAFTWQLTQFPLLEMLERATEDNSPPLYYVLLQGWCKVFGDSAVAMRSLSVLCGVAAVGAVYALARELNRFPQVERVAHPHPSPLPGGEGDKRAISPLVAAALMAASPFQIAMSGEARPYALGVLLAVLSTWGFVRIVRGRATWRAVVAYWSFTTLFVYTHHFAWFIVSGQALYALGLALWRFRWTMADLWKDRSVRQVATALVGMVVAYSLWLPTLVRQTSQVAESFWVSPPSVLGFSTLVYRLFVMPNIAVDVEPVDALTAGILFVMAIVCLTWRARAVNWLVLSLILCGIGLPLFFSSSVASIMNPRYFVFAHVFMLLGIALLIERAPTIGTCRILAVGAVCASLFAYFQYARQVDLGNPDDGFMAVAAYLDEHRTNDDPVLVSVAYAFFPVLAHAERKENIKLYVKDRVLHFHGIAALTPDLMASDRALEHREGENRRLWLVEMENVAFDLPDGWKRNLRATFLDDFVPGRELYVTQCTSNE
jgi:uncharacterized membrane protein